MEQETRLNILDGFTPASPLAGRHWREIAKQIHSGRDHDRLSLGVWETTVHIVRNTRLRMPLAEKINRL